ncbi:19486_t:CDS:2, partial [Rhizophagus irregularis]
SNKQKQQRFQEETLNEGSKRQQERMEEESDPNKMSDKTNKSTSKSSLTKTEEESDLNETSDKTNKSTSKSSPIKSILKSAKSTKLTQEESVNEIRFLGEASSAPLTTLPEEQLKLRNLLAAYNEKDIYNADEMELFFK